MNYSRLVWKNLWLHSLKSIFNLMLVAVAVSLIVLLILINKQFGNHLGKTSENINMILCAKGSPLQSVLCNIFHIDAPTGNIKVEDIKPFLRSTHPLIQRSSPLALGDSYKSSRIVGTTLEYFEWMNLEIEKGRIYAHNFEIVIGSEIATHEKIKINDTIFSNHGLVDLENEMKHEHGLIVVGILKKKNTIADKLIFTPISTYWKEHDHKDLDPHEDDTISTPEVILHNQDLVQSDKEVSSVLIQFRGNNIQTLNFGRSINESSKLMAVNPAIEISRLYELTNSASDLLYWIAIILGFLSSIAIFINLVQALEERKLELAILRIGGASPRFLFFLLISEGLIISALGSMIGILLAHGFLQIAAMLFDLGDKYGIYGHYFCKEEFYIFVISLLCGILAAIIPAYRAYRQDIAKTIA